MKITKKEEIIKKETVIIEMDAEDFKFLQDALFGYNVTIPDYLMHNDDRLEKLMGQLASLG